MGKMKLAKMFQPGAELTASMLEDAAFVAISMCEIYVARGSFFESSRNIDWCDFLDSKYIAAWSKVGSDKNAVKQGPIDMAGYKHMGVLADHLLAFGLRALTG